MDEETRAALDLNGDQLRSMRDAGQPGVVAKRPRDSNQMAASIVRDSTERDIPATVIPISAADFTNVTFSGVLAGTVVRLDAAPLVTVSP
jgi:hypothetical protein